MTATLRRRLFAAIYARTAEAEPPVVRAQRSALLAPVRGTVLEVGAGSGVNLPHYRGVEHLVLSEPDPFMRRRLVARSSAGAAARPRIVDAAAEALPFADACFDAVVCTLVLCSVADPTVALAEIHRVLRPTGRLYLLEHVRSQDPAVVRRQDRLTPAARWLSGDHFNRDTLGAVAAAGFGIGQVERLTLPGRLGAVQPLVVAVAEPERR